MENNTTKKYKVAVLCICLNEHYWQFADNMLWGMRTFFLKNHDVDFLVWSDMPPDKLPGATVFEAEAIEWPMPTLMRYHLFLQQEELLQKYDYLFYIDVDMQIVDWITEEILGEGLTASQHPMYALRPGYYPPFEHNPQSSAYIPLPGRVVIENGQPRFEPLYFAGGFQGGKSKDFINAMKVMRGRIDKDFGRNYVARWNDESHWNRYLYENPPSTVLSPSYIYPDSLIAEYYVKIWGRNYSPKIITLTKSFSISKEAGAVINQQLRTM